MTAGGAWDFTRASDPRYDWVCVCLCVCNPSRAPEQAGLALHSLQAATSAPGLVRQYTETPAKLSHTDIIHRWVLLYVTHTHRAQVADTVAAQSYHRTKKEESGQFWLWLFWTTLHLCSIYCLVRTVNKHTAWNSVSNNAMRNLAFYFQCKKWTKNCSDFFKSLFCLRFEEGNSEEWSDHVLLCALRAVSFDLGCQGSWPHREPGIIISMTANRCHSFAYW